MKNTEELLNLILTAHGGLNQWNRFNEVDVHVKIGGLTWAFKGQEGILDDVHFNAHLHEQFGSYAPFKIDGQRSIFSSGRVAIESTDGKIVQELKDPRASFIGHTRETKWNDLQLIYFSSYALWSYLTIPFIFTLPGFEIQEIEPWFENNETWRRLEVLFPNNIETHSKKQVFYFGSDGLLKRHDYWAVVLGGLPAAHYVSDYREFSGIRLPTKRTVYSLSDDNTYKSDPVFVTIDVIDAKFT